MIRFSMSEESLADEICAGNPSVFRKSLILARNAGASAPEILGIFGCPPKSAINLPRGPRNSPLQQGYSGRDLNPHGTFCDFR
jgi:hypothetical protein